MTLTKCGSLKRVAEEVNNIGRCVKRSKKDLPDELIFENIMTRVSVSTLMRCCCVSKHWYNSIHDDPHFEISYLAHQSSKKDLPFVFYNLNVPYYQGSKFPNLNFIFRLEKDGRKLREKYIAKDIFVTRSTKRGRIELVGNCNGLVCLSRSFDGIMIVNPSRDELFTIFNPPIIKNDGYIVCCYGFGFDSLTHEYKLVFIVTTTANAAVKNSEFKCLVFTLGSNSWRETSTTIPLSPVTTTSFYKSAIFCCGALFWRTKSSSSSSSSDNNNMLLLSFDLHDDEFQVIPLPAECAASCILEPEHQIIDRLLEFKGSPCVARLEKTILGGRAGMCSSTSTSSDDQNTSYCYKVHLHILKEYSKVGRPNEHAWIKETFDVDPHSFTDLLSPAAPCIFTSGTTTVEGPLNRIMSSSDGRIFLYCFREGQVIETYDLQTKRTCVAKYSKYAGIFKQTKHSDVYDQIDYHLSSGHIENFMSMLSFIPKGGGEGAPLRLDRRELISILNDKQRTPPLVGHLCLQPQKSPPGHYRLLI